MRRLLATAVAACATLLAAPANAMPTGELTIVADGPAWGTVTVPMDVALDMSHSTLRTSSPYFVLVAYRDLDTEPTTLFMRTPVSHETYDFGTTLAKGRSTVRLLTAKPFTLTVRAIGLRGRQTVRLTHRIADSFAKVTQPATAPNVALDEIAYTNDGPSYVVHGYTAPDALPAPNVERLCLGDAATAWCEHDDEIHSVNVSPLGSFESMEAALDADRGDHAGKMQLAAAAPTGAVSHFLLVLPLT